MLKAVRVGVGHWARGIGRAGVQLQKIGVVRIDFIQKVIIQPTWPSLVEFSVVSENFLIFF